LGIRREKDDLLSTFSSQSSAQGITDVKVPIPWCWLCRAHCQC